MKQSIFRKLVSHFQKNKKQLWTAVLLLSIIGIVLPSYTSAFTPALIGGAVGFVIISTVIHLLIAISNIVLTLVVGLLTMVTSATFVDVSFTTNDFVTYGWTLTRDLANVGFIILLAVIGLGTALRIKEYQWQKTLPRLFIIMLLINFTPVICGVIIDGSNIVMNYFLSGAGSWNAFYNHLSTQKNMVLELLFSFNELDSIVSSTGNFLIQSVMLLLITWSSIMIYLLFTALFLARYVMLWLLVILSPIAFFTYVFKESGLVKKFFPGILHWTEWWDQFLQWSIVGITMGFFLHLSNNLLAISKDISFASVPVAIDSSGWFNESMPFIVTLVLLYVGFFVSIKSAPMGAGMIYSAARKYGTRAADRVRKSGYVKSIEFSRKARKKLPETMGKAGRWARKQKPVEKRLASGKVKEIEKKIKGLKTFKDNQIKKIEPYATKIAGKKAVGATKWAARGVAEGTKKLPPIHAPFVKPEAEAKLGDEKERKKFEGEAMGMLRAGNSKEVVRRTKLADIFGENKKAGYQSALEKAMPHLSGKDLDEIGARTTAEDWNKYMLPKALERAENLMTADVYKVQQVEGKKGSVEKIKSIKKGLNEKDSKGNNKIIKEIDRLDAFMKLTTPLSATRKENVEKAKEKHDRLVKLIHYTDNSPYFN